MSVIFLLSPVLIALIALFIALYIKVLPFYIDIFKKDTYYTSFKVIVFFGHFVFALACLLTFGILTAWDIRAENVPLILIGGLIISPVYLYICFLPYFIAHKKNHIQSRAIYILNILSGWFPITWIIALIWANTEPAKRNVVINQEIQHTSADELEKYKDLLDRGIITQEEFDAKKKQILGL